MHAPASEFLWPSRNNVNIPDLHEQSFNVYFPQGILDEHIAQFNPHPPTFNNLAYVLYHVGVSLINTGQAYQREIFVDGKLHDPLVPSITTDQVTRARLLEMYNKLIDLEHPTPQAAKPFHYIFIIKVALDHLPEALILKIFTDLGKISETAYNLRKVEFPNGTICSGAKAIYDILRTYIHSRKERSSFASYVAEHPELFQVAAPYILLGIFTIDPRVSTLCRLDIVKEINRMPLLSGIDVPEARSTFFFRRDAQQAALFNIDEEKKIITGYFEGYTSPNKLSYLTRTNTDRAAKLVSDIKAASTLQAIDSLVATQEEYLNSKQKSSGGLLSWFSSNDEKRELTTEEKQQSGFYKAVSNARIFLNVIKGQQQPAPVPAEHTANKM